MTGNTGHYTPPQWNMQPLVCREEKGYVPIVKYGEEFEVARKGRKARKPVKLLYSSGNHYDLLLPSLL